jgi:hypothetical protein
MSQNPNVRGATETLVMPEGSLDPWVIRAISSVVKVCHPEASRETEME